jgi:hypothetical protein
MPLRADAAKLPVHLLLQTENLLFDGPTFGLPFSCNAARIAWIKSYAEKLLFETRSGYSAQWLYSAFNKMITTRPRQTVISRDPSRQSSD